MKSILHNKKDRTCYLCMMLHGDDSRKDNLHEHHVIHGWANRRLSEKYGLKVYLCIYHHEIGKEAVHQNAEINQMLREQAQRAFEDQWPEEDFTKVFGKNYIWDRSKSPESLENTGCEQGFIPLNIELEKMGW